MQSSARFGAWQPNDTLCESHSLTYSYSIYTGGWELPGTKSSWHHVAQDHAFASRTGWLHENCLLEAVSGPLNSWSVLPQNCSREHRLDKSGSCPGLLCPCPSVWECFETFTIAGCDTDPEMTCSCHLGNLLFDLVPVKVHGQRFIDSNGLWPKYIDLSISDVSELQEHAGWQMSKRDICSWQESVKEKAPAMYAICWSTYWTCQHSVVGKHSKETCLWHNLF